jgi:chemotaxis protein methyltransferase CheR
MSPSEAADLKLLTDLIQERFGLTFDGVRLEILGSRLGPRLRELHLKTPRDYYQYLRFHPDRELEFARLPPVVTNNETYFFREAHQFDLLARHVVPERRSLLVGRPFRVLSAGCSSGEEAYSIGITFQNAATDLVGVAWEIDGCDLNAVRIEKARAALYEETSLRCCDDETRRRYFRSVGRQFQLKEPYRRGVRFFPTNLLAANGSLGWSRYDAIFCRNLLIYFHEAAFEALIGHFSRWLAPGGYLFLGHSESLLDRKTPFLPVSLPSGVLYRKRVEA